MVSKAKTFSKVSSLLKKAHLKKQDTNETTLDASEKVQAIGKTLAMNKSSLVAKRPKKVPESELPVSKKAKTTSGPKPDLRGEAPDEARSVAEVERNTVAAREKELKGLSVDELKKLVTSMGLETAKKEDMIKVVVSIEAKLRAKERARLNEIRGVILRKKEYFEAKSASELKDLCSAIGVKGILSKPERVEHLLAQWQKEDGVDKALVEAALDKRKATLKEMDLVALKKLCEKTSVDPYVKEVMVDRIIKCESMLGRFAAPMTQFEQKPAETIKSGDMVASMLAHESERKKEKELKQKQEEVAASKKKELRAMSIDELKKALSKKGLEASGKKDELVEALFARSLEEEGAAARRSDLKAMALSDLRELLSSKGLGIGRGKKDEMVETMLAAEAKHRDLLRAHASKVLEVAEKVKKELEEKSANELKDICVNKGLKAGVGKEDRIQRLAEEAARDGHIDRIIEKEARESRAQALNAMEKAELVKLCDNLDVDALVKDIMIERILARESELGTCLDVNNSESAAKKSRRK